MTAETASLASVFPIQFSNSRADTRHRPYSWRRRVRRSPLSSPSKHEGMARRSAQPLVSARTVFRCVRRLSARHGGVLLRRRVRAFGCPRRPASGARSAAPFGSAASFEPRAGLHGPTVSELLAAGHSARRAEARRRPGAGGSVRPPRAGAASCSTIRRLKMTPSTEQDAHQYKGAGAGEDKFFARGNFCKSVHALS